MFWSRYFLSFTVEPDLQRLFKKAFSINLLIVVVTAIFSAGFFHMDEHYQILEFANYKLGKTPAGNLPWEFGAALRTALQPLLVYITTKALGFISLDSPFSVTFLLRLFTALLNWMSALLLCTYFLTLLKRKINKKLLIILFAGLWYLPFLYVRFSAGMFGSAFFYLALGLLLLKKDYKTHILILCGFLLAISVVARIQIGLLVFIAFIFFLRQNQLKFKQYLVIIVSFGLTYACSLLVDYWFYERWVFPPMSYVNFNLIQGRASEFGIAPWWFLFRETFTHAIPPFSILIIAAGIANWLLFRNRLASWLTFFFFVGHSFIPHKEMRFMFTLAVLTPILLVQPLELIPEDLFDKIRNHKLWRFFQKFLIYTNCIILVFAMFRPAYDLMYLYYKMYNKYNNKAITLIAYNTGYYQAYHLELFYYRPDKLEVEHTKSSQAIIDRVNNAKSPLLVGITGFFLPAELKVIAKSCTVDERSIPAWVRHFNFNHWLERTRVYSVFRCQNLRETTRR